MKTLNSFIMLIIFCQSTNLKIMAGDFKSNANTSNITSLKKQYQYDLINRSFSHLSTRANNNDESENVSYKSPWLAFGLSYLIPGLGQLYNGEIGKGLLFASVTILGFGVGVLPGIGQKSGSEWPLSSYLGFGIAGATYLWSIIDAPISANKINERIKQQRRINVFSSPNGKYVLGLGFDNFHKSYSVGMQINY